jgi:hypothetical protein
MGMGVKYVPDPQKADGKIGTGSNLTWPSIPGASLVPKPGSADSATVSTSTSTPSTPLSVSTTALAEVTAGAYYSDVLEAGGGAAPFTWTKVSGDLPAGLTLSSNGIISGIATEDDPEYLITFRVTDALSATASAVVSLPVTGFVPSDLGSNLVGWWKSYTGILETPVETWSDQSGEGNDLITPPDVAVFGPTLLAGQLNGKPSVIFDGVSHWMQTAGFTLIQPATIYILFKQVTWTLNSRIFDGSTTDSFTLHQKTTTPNLAFYANNDLLQTDTLDVNTWGIMTIVANGASSILQLNNDSPVTGNPGNESIGGFTLGALADGSVPGNIAVVEIVLRNTADGSDVRQSHIDYLATVGGLTI